MPKAFLNALRRTCDVLSASHAAGFADSSQLRKYKGQCSEFSSDWEEALMAGTDVLISEATRRAKEGVFEGVYYKGEMVGGKYKHSDTLLQMLIRAHRPEYRDKTSQTVDVGGAVGVVLLPMTSPNMEEWENRVAEYHKLPQLLDVPGEKNTYTPVKPVVDGSVPMERV